MGMSREPGVQKQTKLCPVGPSQSCISLPGPINPHNPHTRRTAPPAGSRSHSAHKKGSSHDQEPSAQPVSPAEPHKSGKPGPAADTSRLAGKCGFKSRPSKHDSQQCNSSLRAAGDGQQSTANEPALRWKAGLKSGGQRSSHRLSEYHRQFSWKKPMAASPLLTAEQVLYPSQSAVPSFKKNPVPVQTEYQCSYQGLIPPTKPHLQKHLDHQRVPPLHTHTVNKKRAEGSQKEQDVPTPTTQKATPPLPPQRAHRRPRMTTEYKSNFHWPLYRIQEAGGAAQGDTSQVSGINAQSRTWLNEVQELRQKALWYRQRAWGTNFSRDHLSQLLSEHNALWEPTDTTDSATEPRNQHLTFDLCHNNSPDPDSRSASCVEALDLASRSTDSSRRTSSAASEPRADAQMSQSPPPGGRLAWGEDGDRNIVEGRLPTPTLKARPVQRTHHDRTTPATGGAILVGKLQSTEEPPPSQQQKYETAVSTAAERPVTKKEAWPESDPTHVISPSPTNKEDAHHLPKPIMLRQKPASPVAPPPLHCIQGTLRHPEFQHNGDLGLRFREFRCYGGACGSDEGDRLSEMSWRSAASCSMASAVLKRTQKRRKDFWERK
ncbi:nuclear protein MDM1 [Thalassophryne amazonica]|uniref:nuclear protein MDM1 n=1 Tax=Thalassophryne amazonica TaxID=390379 RepID=UPI0014726599|nr:nuclear protein MDM1 [Thalassophryne amazonica]